ncbi:hypothetical protein Zmor_026339 [Zophobas morio]|uniref:Uncharacterized protein n=1 Tax=Zophobas morio TaxID=2755281 RepID=A0AA38HTX2_9CUCU|nr:hypothetical protein Zmor_026339 [Zophobas morio]
MDVWPYHTQATTSERRRRSPNEERERSSEGRSRNPNRERGRPRERREGHRPDDATGPKSGTDAGPMTGTGGKSRWTSSSKWRCYRCSLRRHRFTRSPQFRDFNTILREVSLGDRHSQTHKHCGRRFRT